MSGTIKVMVVDDNNDFLYTMEYWLKSKDYDVVTAPDGLKAIDALKKNAVDIIFLDLHMPVMDGVETLKNIRAINKEIPVIIITAHTTDEKIKDLNKYGVSGFFSKDKDFSETLPLIESVLRLKKKKQQSF